MGTVYLCEHAVLGRRYAVKVLRPELGGDPELAERFRNEAIAASRIGGDNVVDVLDYGAEDDGALYYVMEALEGRSLGAMIAEEGAVEVPRALELLDQLCRALAAAHARGVVHRDVKPDNVFVVRRPDGSEQVKVIDFGISQVAPADGRERLTRAGAIIGTPEYMAPEQAAGDPVDHRADVYALGVLGYELLTGTLPIIALTPVATLVAHQTRTPEAPSRRRKGIPPAVDALLLRALAKRPDDRFATMDAFAAAIAEIRGVPASVPATPPPAARTLVRSPPATVALPEALHFTRRGVRSRAAGVALAAAAIAGLAGAGAWWAHRAGETATPAPSGPSVASPEAAQSRGAAPTAEPPSAPTPPAAPPAPSAPSVASPEATQSRGAPPATTPAPFAPSVASPEATQSRGAPPTAPRRSRTRPAPRPDAHLEDPYGSGALKDPYR